MKILGIDPGTATTGFGVIEKKRQAKSLGPWCCFNLQGVAYEQSFACII